MSLVVLYWEMMRSQLRDRNAGERLMLRHRVLRGHRLALAAIVIRLGPPYNRAWPRLTYLRHCSNFPRRGKFSQGS